jgi:hypothetical protein
MFDKCKICLNGRIQQQLYAFPVLVDVNCAWQPEVCMLPAALLKPASTDAKQQHFK